MQQHNPDDKKTGVIAGIDWLGEEINEELLPQIPTHIQSVDIRLRYFERLSECPKARPFISLLHLNLIKVSENQGVSKTIP